MKLAKFCVPVLAAAILVLCAAEPAPAQIPATHYICFHFTTPLPLMNFTIKGGGKYVDAGGRTGSYDFAGGRITFHGGNFDGQHAVFRGGNPPTIAIVSPRGVETEVCQPGQN